MQTHGGSIKMRIYTPFSKEVPQHADGHPDLDDSLHTDPFKEHMPTPKVYWKSLGVVTIYEKCWPYHEWQSRYTGQGMSGQTDCLATEYTSALVARRQISLTTVGFGVPMESLKAVFTYFACCA